MNVAKIAGIVAGASAVVVSVSIAIYSLVKLRRSETQTREALKLRDDDRVGRVTAEKELRRLQQEEMSSTGLRVRPIGAVQSCYRERNGTPRQGCLVPAGRGLIRLRPDLNPVAMTDSLAEFSHIWVVV
jgi:hypothetical protein